MRLKGFCHSFSLFWWVCIHFYFYSQSFEILFLNLNLVHSARHFPSKFYIIPISHFLFPICQSQQHFNYLACSTCKVLNSDFALLQNTLHLLLSQPSSYFAAPFTVPGGDLRVLAKYLLHVINLTCTMNTFIMFYNNCSCKLPNSISHDKQWL